MRELFDLLNQKERKTLQVILVLLLFAVFFLLFFGLRERGNYRALASSLASTEKEHEKAKQRTEEKEREWQSWKKSQDDLEELRKTYFYQEDEEYNDLRLSLQKVFNESGVSFSDIQYTYALLDKENVGRISVSFTLLGAYFTLKRFIHAVEQLPKFLVFEKIDFLDTPSEGGLLRLKITLAGYSYAS